MVIKRKVAGRQELLIELTEKELCDAYHEQEHNYDVEDVQDIFNNMEDEEFKERGLTRKEAESSMLLQDIEYSLNRLSDIDKRIEFALILAVYTAYINAKNNYEFDCDNEDWRASYIKSASDVDFEYDEYGLVSSEWAYNKADEIAKALYAEQIQL